jgi:hypothetical protein
MLADIQVIMNMVYLMATCGMKADNEGRFGFSLVRIHCCIQGKWLLLGNL